MRRILVTGGCGFIGSHTCLELLEKNYEVWVVDSLVNSSHLVLERIKKLSNKSNNLKFFKGDVRDINFIRKVFQKAISKILQCRSVFGIEMKACLKDFLYFSIFPIVV